jgi:phenylalanyl-tRNA synthetase beta chain
MKISLNWLKEYYQTGLSAEEIAAALTGSGLEVDGIESFESLPKRNIRMRINCR